MNIKWAKIKNNIFNEKLLEIDNLLIEASSKTWISNQIKNNNSLRLNLEEYRKLNSISNSKEFRNTYVEILNKKEEDLKLEVVSELITDNQLLDPLIYWYLDNESLPQEQFNEALGQFWGDLWKGAKVGAGMEHPMGGTFANAGLGHLLGRTAGSVYGGGRNLLKKIWSWRKNQSEFDITKEQALEVLKRLKSQASNFELDANFKHMLDSIIEKLGTAKAFKVAQPKLPEPAAEPEFTPAPITPQEPAIPIGKPTAPPPRRRSKKKMEVPTEKSVISPDKKIEQTKLGNFQNPRELINYYDEHKNHLGVLGLALSHFNVDWKPGDTIEVDTFPLDKINELVKRYEHMHSPDNAETLNQYIPMAEAYIERLRQIEDTKTTIESCGEIKNKYLKLLREQVSL